MKHGCNSGNSTGNSPITNWSDLAGKSRDNLSDIIRFASFAGVDAVFETWGTDSGQKGRGAHANTRQQKVVNAPNSIPSPLRRMAFVREGIQWKNTLLVDVDVDLEYALLSFREGVETQENGLKHVSVLRFNGPFISDQHPLVLTLRDSMMVPLRLIMHVAGSGDEAIMDFDLVVTD